MDCSTASSRLAEHGGRVGGLVKGVALSEREELLRHLHGCGDCTRKAEQFLMTLNELKTLPRRAAPPDLEFRLRALSARVRAAGPGGAARPLHAWWNRHRMVLKDAMRPLAVPCAGGLCVAVMLFSMLVPTFTMAQQSKPDVPIGLSTEAAVKNMAPLGVPAGDAVVDLIVDGNGRIVDYEIVSYHGAEKDALRRSIENMLLFTTFTPATAFGQPMPGRIRLTFRTSQIDVRG